MKKTLAALVASLAVSAAFAQSSAPAATTAATTATPAPAASGAPATHREARVEERIASLHASLKITAQQEGDWSKFADVMRDNAHAMGDLYRQRLAQANTTSAVDDMKQYAQIAQAQADGTKRLVDAFEPLYASLSPEQKKLADTTFHQSGRPHGHKGPQRPKKGAANPDTLAPEPAVTKP